MRLVGGELDIAVERLGSLILGKGDIGVFHRLQASKPVVGCLQVLGGIGSAGGYEGVVPEHRRAQVYPLVVGVATHIVYAPHHIHGMRPDAVPAHGIGMDDEGEIHLGHSSHGVGPKGDVVLVESVVSPVDEEVGDTLALAVEITYVESPTPLETASAYHARLAQQRVDGGIAYVVIHIIHRICHSGMEHVGGIHHLMALLGEIHLHRTSEITLIAHECGKVVAALTRLERVEHHGCLAHRLQCAVEPFGGVATGKRVDAQWHLPCREPALVAPLTHIRLILRRVDIGIALVLLHLHLVEHIIPVGNEFRCRTRGEQHTRQQHFYVSFNAHYFEIACKVKTLFVTLLQNCELIIYFYEK